MSRNASYPAAAEEVVDLKLAKLAAALAAAFVILLSCPLLGQEEESGRHPLPPRGGQPEAPPDDPAAGISVGTPVPDPSVPAPAATLSAGEADRQAQAEFHSRLRQEAPGIRAAWEAWMAERSAKSVAQRPARPAPRVTRVPRTQTQPVPAPQGHKRVYQSVKDWNPASASFVEARDAQEAKARHEADQGLEYQIQKVRQEGLRAVAGLRNDGLAVAGGFAFLVAAGFVFVGAQLRRT